MGAAILFAGSQQSIPRAHPLQHAAGAQAGRRLLVVLFQGDVQAVGHEANENVRLDAPVELVVDGPQPEVALEGAEALLDAHEVDVLAPESGGVFAC